MNAEYHFEITPPNQQLSVFIKEADKEGLFLTASFIGRKINITGLSLVKYLFQYPFMSAKIILGIHWEALKLWLKGVPYISHKTADNKVTSSKINHCTKVVGVVSEKPAFIMNGSLEGMSVAVALTGRVPCRVCGPVKKGDMIVSCEQEGCGRAEAEPRQGALIGKSLVNDDSTGERLVEIVVGK